MTDHRVNGFRVGGIAAGIKPKQKRDLGLIFSAAPASVAGVFTRNQIQAAPVVLDRDRISSGVSQAVIVNSGIANCCTGERGMRDAAAMTRMTAEHLGLNDDKVLVASTGVIGAWLPMKKIQAAIPRLVGGVRPEGFDDFAEAIMTTDTVPKLVTRRGVLNDIPFTVTGAAKGAGMIHPDMATMLAFICTDAGATAGELDRVLRTGVERSLNRITIDGDTSTNDTTLLFANGRSGATLRTIKDKDLFQATVHDVMETLARQLVKDGEGATKLVTITVKGARSQQSAHTVADTVAKSALVKTALFGEDANWGRIVAAVGRAGVPIEPDRIKVFFDGVLVFAKGGGVDGLNENLINKVLKQSEYAISIDLGMGSSKVTVITCDLSVEYVQINADYRT